MLHETHFRLTNMFSKETDLPAETKDPIYTIKYTNK